MPALRLLAAVAVVLTVGPALAQSTTARDSVPLQLESIPVPVERENGSRTRGYVSIFLEVPSAHQAQRLCNLLPKVNDAISLTFEGRPVRSVSGTYDLANHAERLRKRLNAAFGEPIVLQLYLRQGLSRMASGDLLRLHGNMSRTCRALKVLPWQAHLLEEYQTEERAAGAALLAKRSGDTSMSENGEANGDSSVSMGTRFDQLLRVLMTPGAMFSIVFVAGALLIVGGALGWFIARRRREHRRRQRRAGRDRRQRERRGGADRRKGDKGYAGAERRSGEDRREDDRRAAERREGDRREEPDGEEAAGDGESSEVEALLDSEVEARRD